MGLYWASIDSHGSGVIIKLDPGMVYEKMKDVYDVGQRSSLAD
jgi:hypothetical protein